MRCAACWNPTLVAIAIDLAAVAIVTLAITAKQLITWTRHFARSLRGSVGTVVRTLVVLRSGWSSGSSRAVLDLAGRGVSPRRP